MYVAPSSTHTLTGRSLLSGCGSWLIHSCDMKTPSWAEVGPMPVPEGVRSGVLSRNSTIAMQKPTGIIRGKPRKYSVQKNPARPSNVASVQLMEKAMQMGEDLDQISHLIRNQRHAKQLGSADREPVNRLRRHGPHPLHPALRPPRRSAQCNWYNLSGEQMGYRSQEHYSSFQQSISKQKLEAIEISHNAR